MNAELSRRGRESKPVGLKAIWESASGLPHLSQKLIARHLLGRACSNMRRAPLTALVTTLTIAVSLFMLAAFVLAVENARRSLSAANDELVLSLYLKPEVGMPDAAALREQIASRPEIKSVQIIGKQEALDEFKRALGDQAFVAEGLELDNPLPITLEVQFRPGEDVAQRFDALASEFGAATEVDQVQYSQGFVRQFGAILSGARWAGAVAILVMFSITGFIIANTIKLALYSHREEIEIMHLVGATDSFIRAPYMIEGAIQGLAGSILGLSVLYLAFTSVREAASHSSLLQLFASDLNFLSVFWCIGILLIGCAIGLLGSFLAVRRFSVE